MVQAVDIDADRLGRPLRGIARSRFVFLAGWFGAGGAHGYGGVARLRCGLGGGRFRRHARPRRFLKRFNARLQDAGNSQPILDGLQGLVSRQAEAEAIEVLDPVKLLRRWIAGEQLPDFGKSLMEDLGLQSGGGKRGLEGHLAGVGYPA